MFNKKKIEKLEERIESLESKIQLICNHDYDYKYTYSDMFMRPEIVLKKCVKCGYEESMRRSDVPELLYEQEKREFEKAEALYKKNTFK